MRILLQGFACLSVLLPISDMRAWQAPVLISPKISVDLIAETNASTSNETNATLLKKPVRSSKQETIDQAGRDLRHVEENVRSGAARLLGKYPSPASAAYLTFALDDRIARVRRAAIVSLSEL